MNLRLREIRQAKGLTLEQLAEIAGTSKGFLSQIETGSRNPSTDMLTALSVALGVSETDMIQAQGFSEPGAPDTMARRVLESLDRNPVATETDFRVGTDGQKIQIIATVDRSGLDRLIRKLEAMKAILDA